MQSELLNKVEELFYDYARKYDENIKNIFNRENINISNDKLQEILDQAKNMIDT